ncbi:MAG TPA: SDR family oxidoreductase [Ktedonobacterales bacterium]|nr:SDR family oxidoreductase [Ktedonobacterales bacterium]
MQEILNNKVAVVYGAGSIGAAVASAFAQAGATVFVADHHDATLNKLADQAVQTVRLDVLDKDAVAAFVTSVVEQCGHVDISLCATSTHTPGGEQGAAFDELSYEDFALPMMDYTKATFNTAQAVYPQMIKQRAGVIMGMTAVVSRMPLPYTAGFGPAWAAVEAMLRLLAAELGPYGVRTVCLRSAGSDGAADKTLATGNPDLDKRTEQWGQRWMSRNLLGRGPTLAEVGQMAAFMASDLAGATTGTTVNLDGGMIAD